MKAERSESPGPRAPLAAALLWGAAWGVGEATLGYALHFAPLVAGTVMFPFGALMMGRAWSETGRFQAVFLTGLTAALIKLSGLLLPYQPFASVLNPAQAIVLECLAFMLIVRAHGRSGRVGLGAVASAVVMWRTAFALLATVEADLPARGNVASVGQAYVAGFLGPGLVAEFLLLFFVLRYTGALSRTTVVRSPAFRTAAALFLAAVAVWLELAL